MIRVIIFMKHQYGEGKMVGAKLLLIEDDSATRELIDLLPSKTSKTPPYGYVTKPITKDQLFATIELALHTVKIEKERVQLIDEIKTLRGLLPICANCKNIRDDKGYWHEIEEYFTSRSEASFTNGIYPKCQEKLYPGYDS